MSVTVNSNCDQCIIKSYGVCAFANEKTKVILEQGSVTQTCSANQTIWDGEVAMPFVAIVTSGYVRMLSYGLLGKRQIVSIFKPGEMIGGTSSESPDYCIEASTTARICRIERPFYDRALRRDRGLQRAVYDAQLAKLDQLYWLTWSLAGLTAEERLAAFLAMATTYMPYQLQPDGSAILTIDLPRSDIADLLCTSLESISRVTKRLEKQGYIKILDARHFRVPDLSMLIKLGCLEGNADLLRPMPVPKALRQDLARHKDYLTPDLRFGLTSPNFRHRARASATLQSDRP